MLTSTPPRELPAAAPINRTLQWIVWSVLGLIVAGLVAGLVRQYWQAAERRGATTLDHFNRVPDFTLTERSGQPFTSASALKGKVWLASFFFTACPGPCLRMNGRLQEIQAELTRGKHNDVRIASFSIAPEMDTPEVLRKYAERFHATDQWFFLTGDREKIYGLAHDVFTFAVKKVDDPADEMAYVHSTRIALVDRDGVVRGSYDTTNPDGSPNEEVVQQVLTGVGDLLREPASGK